MPGLAPETDQGVPELRIVGRFDPCLRREQTAHVERHEAEVAQVTVEAG